MFGSYRYMLALVVMSAHTMGTRHTVAAAAYAVFAFYLLSGFLMAQVLDTTYRSPVNGTGRFLLNRALRIYPPYWVVLGLTACLVWIAPGHAAAINPIVIWPTDSLGWLRNLLIFGLEPRYEMPRFIPVGWSLSVELICYLLMAFGLARHPIAIRLWFAGSVAYTAYMIAMGYGPDARYFPVSAALLPFSTGAMIYLHRDQLRGLVSPAAGAGAIALFVANILVPESVGGDMYNVRFYFSLALAAVATSGLAWFTVGEPNRFTRIDAHLGDLSYPIFLGHLFVALVLEALLYLGPGRLPAGPLLFLSVWPLVHLFAMGVHRSVEAPVQALRTRVRGRQSPVARSRRDSALGDSNAGTAG